jgi:hypothetical protein
VTFSIDPKDTPELARQKKAAYLERLGKPEAAAGWHFLCAAPRNALPATRRGEAPQLGRRRAHQLDRLPLRLRRRDRTVRARRRLWSC